MESITWISQPCAPPIARVPPTPRPCFYLVLTDRADPVLTNPVTLRAAALNPPTPRYSTILRFESAILLQY
jgi:hypothetical protein